MDVATLVFVALLCLAAFLLTVAVRRDFRRRERARREHDRDLRHPRRRP